MDHPIGRIDARTLRLASWNLRSLRDDRTAVIDCLRRIGPDVLFVQEAPRVIRARSRLAALARESDLVVASGGRDTHGVALLTTLRISVDDSGQFALPRTAGLHRRGVAWARMSLGSRSFTAVSVHLGLDAAERRRHAAMIKDHFAGSTNGARAIGGDLNETSGSPAWGVLADGLQDVGVVEPLPTFPASSPQSRIDTLFVPRGWSTELVNPRDLVGDALLVRATDHRPVIVDVVD